MEKISTPKENSIDSLERFQQADTLELGKQFQISTESTLADLALLNSLSDKLPKLSDDPSESLLAIHDFLGDQGFIYDETSMTLHDVLEKNSGSCLSSTMLICSLIESKGKEPGCKLLIHPKDAVDRADKKLFAELMEGEYFDYDNPKLPDISKQPEQKLRASRFVVLGHPIVTLDGIPFETTLIGEKDSNPLVEFPSESSRTYSPQEMISFVYSDQAKLLANKIAESDPAYKGKLLEKFHDMLEKSLAIVRDNRYAISLLWQYAKDTSDNALQDECLEKYKAIKADDSDHNYTIWSMTGDVTWLDRSLQQFPENIPAFIDKHIFLEKDPKEARFNLAVAMWCIFYSGSLSLRSFYNDPQMREKIKKLFPKN